MRVNFFVMFPHATMEGVPTSYMRRLPRAGRRGRFDNGLTRVSRTSPASTSRRRSPRCRAVLDQVVRAVEFLFGFTLAAGLVTVRRGRRDARGARARVRVMRALGPAPPCWRVQRAELLVGALAGVLRRARRWRSVGRWRASPSTSAGTRPLGAAG